LGFPDFGTAGKDHIGNREQFALTLNQLRWSAAKERQLIHTIINDGALVQAAGEGSDSHWVVKPLHRRGKTPTKWPGENRLHQTPLFLIHPGIVAPTRRWHLHL